MDSETVALEFAADVTEAVASVRELTDSATAAADAAKGAADGCTALTESSQAAAVGVDEVAAAAGKGAESLGIYYDAAGRARLANGQFASSSELAAATAKETADSAEAASVSLTAYSDKAKSAAAAAGDLALAQANLKAASAAAKDAVAELAAVQATAGKDSAEYAAQLDVTAAAMGRQKAAAAEVDAASASSAGGLAKYKMALVGVGVGAAVAVDGAVKYQAETTRLVTSAGEQASNLDKVRQGMLALSSQTDQSTAELSSGMYLVESAGFHGAQGLTVLKASAQGAKDEGAQLSTVANGVTDALVDFHKPASDAATVTSQLIAGVSHGKTTFEEFSGSMSTILPLASSLHLSLADVTGVLAEMTAHGMSARQAADDEANAMRELMKPNAAMTKEWGLMGISAQQVNKELSTAGLGGTLQWMSGIAQDGAQKIGQNYNQALGKMIGTAAGLQVALMTTGENAKGTNSAIHDIATASADAKGNVEGFSTVSQTAAFKLGAAGQATKAMGISLGEVLLPSVMAVIGPITSFLQLVASNQAASIAFALVVGGILAGAIGIKLAGALRDAKEGVKLLGEGGEWLIGKIVAMTAAQEAQTVATEAATVAQAELDVAEDASPIGLIIVAIVALIAVIVLVVTHLHFFAHAFDEIRHTVATWAHDVAAEFDRVRHDIAAAIDAAINWLKANWKLILSILLDPVGTAVMEIRQHWKQISAAFSEGYHAVVGVLEGWRHDIASAFDDIRHSVASFIDWLPGFVEKGFQLAVKAQLTMLDTARHDVATAFDDIRHSVSSGVDAVISFFTSLPGKIAAQLAKLPGELLTIGENVIKGLINGIENAAAAIPGIMAGLASKVASYFTNPLQLFSPSRLFFQHGFNIVQGAINGVKANAPALLSAMRELGGNVGAQGIGSSLAAGAAAPAGGSTSVHVTAPLTVQAGSGYDTPQFQQYLQAAMQEATLRYGQLNPTNGLTPAWGR